MTQNSGNNYLVHHGILGQKWGRKNGPPYPLNPSDYSKKELKAIKKYTDGNGELNKKGKKKYGKYFEARNKYENASIKHEKSDNKQLDYFRKSKEGSYLTDYEKEVGKNIKNLFVSFQKESPGYTLPGYKELYKTDEKFKSLVDEYLSNRYEAANAHDELIKETNKIKHGKEYIDTIIRLQNDINMTPDKYIYENAKSYANKIDKHENKIGGLDKDYRADIYEELAQKDEKFAKILKREREKT